METKNLDIISPLMEDAFTEPVLHKVVLSKIDFELPDEIWIVINEGFGNYWNNEVGFGNYADFDDTCRSINKHLESANILFPYDKVETIVNIIYDFVEQIPGAFLDESAVVIPIK
ncbi:MAG: hypothetical protein IK025_00825 [Bacteroidales bacterium]|nr:hypothetical protein [Bacteroidales bacterium]